MKNILVSLAVAALIACGMQKASASDREWATAGKVLTGVAVGAAIAAAVQPGPVYVQGPSPAFYVPPARCLQPAPVVVYSTPYCARPAPVVVYAGPPVVRFGIGFGPGFHHRGHPRICR